MLKHTRAIKSHFTYGVADLIKCLSLRHINILTPNPYKNPNLLWTINNIILFIDPYGTKHTEALGKIDGYKKIFGDENESPKVSYKDIFEIKSYIQIL